MRERDEREPERLGTELTEQARMKLATCGCSRATCKTRSKKEPKSSEKKFMHRSAPSANA